MKVEAKQSEETAIAEQNEKAIATAAGAGQEGLCASGEWGRQGTLVIPQFTLVQPSMEDLVEIGPAGSFIYDKSEVLREGVAKEQLPFTLLHAGLYWRQRLTQEERDQGKDIQNFNTLEEAQAAGMREWNWKDRSAGCVSPASRSLVLVEVPEQVGIFQFEDKHYVKAMWFAHGVAFKPTSQIMTIVQQNKALEGKSYKLNVALSSKKGNKPTYVEPVLHKNGYHSAEFVEWLEKEVL